MSYSIVSLIDNATVASGTTLTQARTYSAGDYVIVWGRWLDAITATATITDGTNTYTIINPPNTLHDATTTSAYATYYCKAPVPGSPILTETVSVAATFRCIAVVIIAGLDNTANAIGNAIGQSAPGAGTDLIKSPNLTPGSQPGMLLGFCYDDSTSATIAAGTGFTSIGTMSVMDAAFGTSSRVEHKRLTATTATTASFTCASGGAADNFVSFSVFVPEASGTVDQPPAQIYCPEEAPETDNQDAYEFYFSAPLSPNAINQSINIIQGYDASEQSESPDEDYGFIDYQLSASVLSQILGIECSDTQFEELEQPEDFSDGYQRDEQNDQILNSFFSDYEEEENPEAFEFKYEGLFDSGGLNVTLSAGGTLTFSGSANQIHERISLPTGSIVYSGSSVQNHERIEIPSGGIVFSGSATELRVKVFTPSGGIIFSGTAAEFRTKILSAGGILLFSGNAPISFIPAGGVTSQTINRLNIKISRSIGL